MPAGGLILFFFRVAKPYLAKSRLTSLIPDGFASTWSIEKAKRIARIAIVDDQPQDFPTAELKADGFDIHIYRQVQLAHVGQLTSYDIVFLDMKGIVKDDPEYGGLKLIAELRIKNPAQKICAVSSKTFDPTATEFFRQADDTRKKPLTAQECKAVIQAFLSELFDAPSLIYTVKLTADSLPRQKRTQLLSLVSVFLNSGKDLGRLEREMTSLGIEQSRRTPILNLIRMIAYEAK